MGYLITQIIICLLIAALIGFVIGWLLRGLSCNEQTNDLGDTKVASFNDGSTVNALSSAGSTVEKIDTSALDSLYSSGEGGAISGSVNKVKAVYHKIEEIEGIGKSLGNHLRNIGIKTTGDLIEKCATDDGFKKVLKAGDADDSVVRHWLRMSDLMRVPDVTGQFAELLDASGIESVSDLAGVNSNALTAKMEVINKQERKIPDSISLADANDVAQWIVAAKDIS